MSNIFNDELLLTLFNEAFYELIDDGMSEADAEKAATVIAMQRWELME
jgi:hypothetical protein